MGLNYCKIYQQNKMKPLLSIFLIGAVFAAPAPQDEDVAIEAVEAVPYVHNEIEAEPYVHDEPLETHDIVAETYVHEDIAAEAYVHEEPVETHDIEAEAYIHEDIAAEPYVHDEPTAAVGTAVVPATYVAAVKTGCINNVGSVVP